MGTVRVGSAHFTYVGARLSHAQIQVVRELEERRGTEPTARLLGTGVATLHRILGSGIVTRSAAERLAARIDEVAAQVGAEPCPKTPNRVRRVDGAFPSERATVDLSECSEATPSRPVSPPPSP